MRHQYSLFCYFFAIGVAAVFANEQARPIEYRTLEVSEGHFRCDVPKDWNVIRDRREEDRIHCYGAYLDGAKPGEGIGPALSVRYFAPDNTLFRGAEGYLQRQFAPSLVKPSGEKTSEVREVLLAGRPAKTFTRDTFSFFPRDSLDTKQIPVREEHYVVPHLGGFVIVRWEAPTASYQEIRPVLQRLLDTLQLLP